jgi:hypothetical protein
LGLLIYFTFEKSGALFNVVSSIKVSQAEMLEIWSLNFTHDDTEIQKNIKN